MIESLTANWLWILLPIGALWFFTRGHGMGCGMGGHSHDSEPSRGEQDDAHAEHAGVAGAAHEHGSPSSAPPRRRGGCC